MHGCKFTPLVSSIFVRARRCSYKCAPVYMIHTENYSIDFFPSFVGTGNQCRLHATIEIDATTELRVKPDLVEKN